MDLRRGFWLLLTVLVLAVLATVFTGCSNILDTVEGLVLRDGGEEVAVEAPASPESEYLAEVKADTTLVAVAAVQAVIEQRWGLRLTAEDLSSLANVTAALQDVLEARALDTEAEELRRLEDRLRALEP